jgi:hypothetical protein
MGLFSRLETRLRQIENAHSGILWPLVTLVTSILIVFMTPVQQIYTFNPQRFPIQATEWIEANPQPGNMFNDLNWGGYLALFLWRGQAVFVDSMADTTGELTREYENVVTLSQNWREIFSHYQVSLVVIRSSSRLADTLEKEGWTILFKDETATILGNKEKP